MTTYLAKELPFPATMLDGFPPLPNEPVFDAAKHLQIEMSETIYSLADLGYSDAEIAACPAPHNSASVGSPQTITQ